MNQKGFIQIPLLIGIIVSIILASGVTTGVVLHKQGKLAPLLASVSKVFENTEDIETEIKFEEPYLKGEQSLLEETNQGEDSQIEQELEQAQLEAEKAKQEAERAKAEMERLKNEQEAQKLTEEQQKQEDQKRREIKERQAEETEKIVNIKAVDEDLSRIIAAAKPKIDSFSNEKNDTSDFIVTIRNTMNKYPASSLIQQSGQQLINESNNLSFILGKLIDIGNSIIREVNSLMGSGVISSELRSLTSQLENYISQRERSRSKTESLIATFVANEKIALDEMIEGRQDELERIQKASQALNQLTVVIQEIDGQLAILGIQIQEKEAEIEAEYDRLVSMTIIERRVAQLIPELNFLIDQWNSFLNMKEKIITLTYKLDDYANYGTPLSAEDRTFLLSLGISL